MRIDAIRAEALGIAAELGFDDPPPWWPVVTLGVAGLLVAAAVTRLPGRGGHVPADGMAGGVAAEPAAGGWLAAKAPTFSIGASRSLSWSATKRTDRGHKSTGPASTSTKRWSTMT